MPTGPNQNMPPSLQPSPPGTHNSQFTIHNSADDPAALSSALAGYRSLFEHARDPMMVIEPNGNILLANQAASDQYGYPREQLCSMNVRSLRASDTLGDVDRDLERGARGEQFQTVHVASNGRHFPVEVSAREVTLFGRKLVFGTNTDITARMAAEQALRESECLFRTLFEIEQTAILLVENDSGRILQANQAAIAMYGLPREQILARRLFDLSAEPEKTLSNIQRRLPGNSLHWHLRADGTRFPTEISATFFTLGGRGVHICRVQDVTERRATEERLLRAERLGAAGQIAGQVAHDFNNLLSPLLSYPELMKEMLPPGDPMISYCDDMIRAATQMADINSDMLTLARRGRLHDSVPVDVAGLLKRAIASFGRLPGGITFCLNVSPGTRPIRGTSAQLIRVVSNLISNAIEAMGSGGVLTVQAEDFYVDRPLGRYNSVEVGDYVRVIVSDTGHGIPDDVKSRIFEPFFTTRRADRKRGSGLGLAIVQAIVQDHDGYVDLESNPGEGTSFYLYFPAFRGELPAESTPSDLPRGTEHILVVDDDPVQRDLADRLLSRLGYKVDVAPSGEEAIEMLKGSPADLLILDMIMSGGIDGAETYRRILEVRPAQKAIILSGFALNDRIEYAQSLGAGTFLRKPVPFETLARAVRQTLDTP